MLCGAEGAANSLERFADDEVAGRGRRIRKPCCLVRLGDRGKAAGGLLVLSNPQLLRLPRVNTGWITFAFRRLCGKSFG